MANDKVMKKNDHNSLIKAAIKSFRETKQKQLTASGDSSNRGAAVELKSQIGSYGNNFNNRAEESIGSAVDLWTAFRENQFPGQAASGIQDG